jgi:hypothetical protein
MANIPSKYRSEKIQELALRFGVTDPYRFLKPTAKDFTYVPRAIENRNRSRLDYFLISEGLCGWVQECVIEPSPRTNAFDHKRVNLAFGNKSKIVNRYTIKNQIIKTPVVNYLMKAVVYECYLHHADPASFPAYQKNNILLDIGRIHHRINQCHDSERKTELLQEVSEIFEVLPDLEFFEQLERSCEDDVFFRNSNRDDQKLSVVCSAKNLHRKKQKNGLVKNNFK